jgi:protoporphyrin/coproporphyrin ferrochelatase
MSKTGVLLVNLGSPDSTSVPDVRRYLREFLMDGCVLDTPWLQRFLVVNLFILPFRPAKTAEAYRKIWTTEGSPLVVSSRHLSEAMRQRLPCPVALAMRYQNPSIEQGLRELLAQGVERVFVAPLYPQYALSSTATVNDRAREVLTALAPGMELQTLPPFFDHPLYLDALAKSAEPYLKKDFDHLLFSFHGLPERHLRKTDPTGCHCLAKPDCCAGSHPAHATCYRAQAFKVVSAFAKRHQLPPEKYSIAFQSRLGRDPWLKPYTDLELVTFPNRGVRKLLVMCPAFVADCLETLEEIGLRGRESFLEAGGKELTLIPCLNEHPAWLDALEKILLTHVNTGAD